jgi:hypothetical protein
MTQVAMKEANVYRVCAEGADRWHVYQDKVRQPVASFDDKAAALNYAMCLASGRIAWHLLLRHGGTPKASALSVDRKSHH